MNDIDIRRLDMTLLLTFSSLMRTGRGAATADELGVTQSSVSHALGRLRDIFGDDLFTRRPHGLEPTRRAVELQPLIAAILDATRAALRTPTFDPAEARGVLRIGALDYHCALLAPPFLQRLSREAPGLQVSFRPMARRAAIAGVLDGVVDFATGLFWGAPATIETIPLWTESYLVIAARGNRAIRNPLTLDAYLKARHLVVSLDGDFSGIVDRALAQRRKARTVVAAVPYFMAALATIERTDLIATVPSRLAETYGAAFKVRTMAPPLPIRSFQVSAIRATRTHADPMIDWALRVLAEVA